MTILCDIGGTYARFAQESAPERMGKFAVDDFESFEVALDAFCAQEKITGQPPLRIATAAFPDGKIWRFVNHNPWVIDPVELEKHGWRVDLILNDFEAATWALAALAENDFKTLRSGSGERKASKVLIGPGTGLGLGYFFETPAGPYVQMTHGGHMPAAALNDEHRLVISLVQRLLGNRTILGFENLVSGPGLFNIYRALCLMDGRRAEYENAAALFENLEAPAIRAALAHFHDFFGLAARCAVIAGHGYSGLYLTGGVLDRLVAAGAFDFARFERSLMLSSIDSINKALAAMPVLHVTKPGLALYGLLAAGKHQES